MTKPKIANLYHKKVILSKKNVLGSYPVFQEKNITCRMSKAKVTYHAKIHVITNEKLALVRACYSFSTKAPRDSRGFASELGSFQLFSSLRFKLMLICLTSCVTLSTAVH